MEYNQFTPDEYNLVQKPHFIHLKNSIIQKIIQKLHVTDDHLTEFFKNRTIWNDCCNLKIPGKVSRGEKYKGLPYAILDYPRNMEKNNVFAVRTMFLWGHEFSVTLHISGKYLEQLSSKSIYDSIQNMNSSYLYFCINSTPWEYMFSDINYTPVDDITVSDIEKQVNTRGFIKVSRKINLDEMPGLENVVIETVKEFEKLLAQRN